MRYQITQRVIELTTTDKVIIYYHWETPLKRDGNGFANGMEFDYARTELKKTVLAIQQYGRGEFEIPFSVVVMMNALYKSITDGYNTPVKPLQE